MAKQDKFAQLFLERMRLASSGLEIFGETGEMRVISDTITRFETHLDIARELQTKSATKFPSLANYSYLQALDELYFLDNLISYAQHLAESGKQELLGALRAQAERFSATVIGVYPRLDLPEVARIPAGVLA